MYHCTCTFTCMCTCICTCTCTYNTCISFVNVTCTCTCIIYTCTFPLYRVVTHEFLTSTDTTRGTYDEETLIIRSDQPEVHVR